MFTQLEILSFLKLFSFCCLRNRKIKQSSFFRGLNCNHGGFCYFTITKKTKKIRKNALFSGTLKKVMIGISYGTTILNVKEIDVKQAYIILSLAALLALANCSKKDEASSDQATETTTETTDASATSGDASEASTDAAADTSSDEKSE